MALKARKPETKQETRIKCIFQGPPKCGKTWAAIAMPKPFVIDSEGGARLEDYQQRIKDAGGMYFGPDEGATDPDECASQVEELARTKHGFLTLVWDSFTVSHEAKADEGAKNPKIGVGYNANYRLWADPWAKRIWRVMTKLDMNIILTSHVKDAYDEGKKIGTVHDSFKKQGYMSDLVLDIERRSTKNYAFVRLSRYALQFPMGDTFEWSVEELVRRFGKSVLDEAVPATLASAEQVAALTRKVGALNIPSEETDKWLEKADADSFADFTKEQIEKAIAYCDKKISEASASSEAKVVAIDTAKTKSVASSE